jgi:hypothetical protein
MTFPAYKSIDLSTVPLKWGYYVPGLISKYRPDIELIEIRLDFEKNTDGQGSVTHAHQDVDYSWLPEQIEKALSAGKKVGLLVEDEHVGNEKNDQLTDIVNHYQHSPVFWLTQYDQRRIQLIYRLVHGFKCQILELPWLILNECLVYNNVKKHQIPTVFLSRQNREKPNNKFFTVTGRHLDFKQKLLEALVQHDLDQHGLLTVPEDHADQYISTQYKIGQQVQIDTYQPYQLFRDRPIKQHDKMAAQFLQNNLWLSYNTQNFLYLEKTYLAYPLAIISETDVFNFFATEKSVWPALLGKMFLLAGFPGCMSYIQRFYDINLSEFLNLEFDLIGPNQLNKKFDLMLGLNREFIVNAKNIYAEHGHKFQEAGNTVGPNLYKFVLAQLSLI